MDKQDASDDSFDCLVCEKQFLSPVFSICRQYEQVIFIEGDQAPEVEVIGSEIIATFCSEACLNIGRDQILLKEKVRGTFPDIGPIETCSRCGRPIDMTRFHLTWTEDQAILERDGLVAEMQPVDAQVLAMVCDRCAPAPTELL